MANGGVGRRVTVLGACIMACLFIFPLAAGMLASAKPTYTAALTVYTSGDGDYVFSRAEDIGVHASWTAYVKPGVMNPTVFFSMNGAQWNGAYTTKTGSFTKTTFAGDMQMGTSYTITMYYSVGWDRSIYEYIYASKSSIFSIASETLVTGTVCGERIVVTGNPDTGYIETPESYPLSGITVEPTMIAIYTCKPSDSTGTYYVSFAGGSDILRTSSFHDHVVGQVPYQYYSKQQTPYLRDVIMQCQWTEWPRPFDDDPDATSTDDLARVFTRDVNADGVVDSVNLFLDAHFWDGIPGMEERPGKATFWLELKGYYFSEAYADPVYSWKDVFPVVKPAGSDCYYQSRAITLNVKTNFIYGDTLWTPDGDDFDPYGISVQGLQLYQEGHYTYPFLTVDRTGVYPSPLQSSVDAFNDGQYEYFYGSVDDWPERGDGTDLYNQMITLGYPNTLSYASYVDCSLQTWPTNEIHTLDFLGYFVSEFDGIRIDTGLDTFEMFTTEYSLVPDWGESSNFGFRIDPFAEDPPEGVMVQTHADPSFPLLEGAITQHDGVVNTGTELTWIATYSVTNPYGPGEYEFNRWEINGVGYGTTTVSVVIMTDTVAVAIYSLWIPPDP